MKKRVWLMLLVALTLSLVFSLAACDLFGNGFGNGGDGSQAPTYKGVMISKTSHLSTDTVIYAQPYQDVFVTINLENPDDLIISSVTLSGKTYEVSTFESVSDRETIVLKINLLDAFGTVTYTLTSVKYIDGNVIKEVALSGNTTVTARVYETTEVSALVTTEVGFTDVTLHVTVIDDTGLIAFSNGNVQLELFSEDTLIEGRGLTVGNNTVTFDNLDMGRSYWYQIVGFFDNMQDGGKGDYLIYNDLFKTNVAVAFGSVTVTYDGVQFDLDWHKDAAGYTVSELHLIDGDNDTELDSTVTSVTGLLSNRDYSVVAYYQHRGQTYNIRLDFHTPEKHAPTLAVSNLWVTEDEIRFDVMIYDPDSAGTLITTLNGQNVSALTGNQKQIKFSNLTYGSTYEIEISYNYDLNDGNGEHPLGETLTVTVDSQTIHQTSCKMGYYELSDGTCAVLANYSCAHSEVHVPSTIDGYVVSALGYKAFAGNTTVASVVLPASVTTIDDQAFSGCTGLTNAILNENIVTIGDSAFENCTNITELTVPSNVVTIGNKAFRGTKLMSLTFETDSQLRTIGDDAFSFYYLNEIRTMPLPERLETIGARAFSGLYLTTLTIPASVVTIRDEAFSPCSALQELIFAGNNLTTIGDSAFEGCINMTELTIPSSVVTIGNKAFSNWKLLETLTFGADSQLKTIGNGAFKDCAVLPEVTIPTGVTSIGDEAFDCCRLLDNIVIPASVESIGMSAFAGTHLQTITFEANSHLESIGAYAFMNNYATSIEIPASVISIGEQAFFHSENLVNLTFEANSHLEIIGASAFATCGKIESLQIPASIVTIDTEAFQACTSLTSVTFAPDCKLETIGDSAFEACRILPSIIIPSSVVTIGGGAFKACADLGDVTFESGSHLQTIGRYAFYELRNLTEIVIPSSVVTIGEGAFRNCRGLQTLTFEANSHLATIGEYAFYYCEVIAEVVIPASVTKIEACAFQYCSGLTSVTFEEGSQLTVLGMSAFEQCRSLPNIILPEGLIEISSQAFYFCESMQWIVIPSTVTTVGSSALLVEYYGSPRYPTIYFGGNVIQWRRISFVNNDDFFKGDRTDGQKAEVYYYVNLGDVPTWRYDDNGNPTPN